MYKLVLLGLSTLPYLTSATLTLACFSIPFTTLPSITLNGLTPILNTSSFALGSNVGSGSTSVFDVCGWGVLSWLVLFVLPGMLLEARKAKTARVSNVPQSQLQLVDSQTGQDANIFVSGLKVSPSIEGNKLQVSPVLDTSLAGY